MQCTQEIACKSVEQDSTENLFHMEKNLQKTILHSVIIKASTWQLLIAHSKLQYTVTYYLTL